MSSTFVIVIKDARSQADMARFAKDTSEPREQCTALQNYFHRAKAGEEKCSFTIQTSASSPVRATGTIGGAYATLTSGDKVTIGGTDIACVTGGSPTSAQFLKQSNLYTTMSNLSAAINANTTLNKFCYATLSGNGTTTGTVTVTCLVPGVIGNLVTTAVTVNSTGLTIGAATLTSGAGGMETVPVTFSRGL